MQIRICTESLVSRGTGRIYIPRTGKARGSVSKHIFKVLFSPQSEGHVWASGCQDAGRASSSPQVALGVLRKKRRCEGPNSHRGSYKAGKSYRW